MVELVVIVLVGGGVNILVVIMMLFGCFCVLVVRMFCL